MMSLLGLVAFLALAWAISLRRGAFPWRTVLAGIALQLVLATLLIRKSPFSDWVYANAKIAADNLLYFARQGTQLVFGPLAKGNVLSEHLGPENAVVLGIYSASWVRWLGSCNGSCAQVEAKASAPPPMSLWAKPRHHW